MLYNKELGWLKREIPPMMRILGYLHKYTFRHMMHNVAYTQVTRATLYKKTKLLESKGLMKSWLEIPTDADRRYRFRKFEMSPQLRPLARMCWEMIEEVERLEAMTGSKK